jgi:hypothetical protein
MADPITILGASAAAIQLTGLALKLTRLTNDISKGSKEAPGVIQRHFDTINQINGISRFIMGNPALQTDSIASILRTMLGCMHKLSTILENLGAHSLTKIFNYLRKEKEVNSLLDQLVKEQQLLILSINEIDSGMLSDIRNQTALIPDIHEQVCKLPQAIIEQLKVCLSEHQLFA